MAEVQSDVRPATTFGSLPLPGRRCPICDAEGMVGFYAVEKVPVHSCLLACTAGNALSFPTGDLKLGLCTSCGFICNVVFDASHHAYSANYEETQGFSPHFNAFLESLARRMIDRYELRNKHILEIGCGKGEFLMLLCRLGANWGIGIDPSYVPGRMAGPSCERVGFIQAFYSADHAHLAASSDFICCRHTLEHIAPVGEFLRLLRQAIGQRNDCVVFFEVPDVTRILREGAFWDFYYEHCSYFSPGSLARSFRSSGFDVLRVELDYDDQYILITAQPAERSTGPQSFPEDDPNELAGAIAHFGTVGPRQMLKWSHRIRGMVDSNQRAVIWGAGSKCVAFLTTLKLGNEIECVVDVNPYKQGSFTPGTGHMIVPPEVLKHRKPDYVIVMNPVYCDEVRQDLERLGVQSTILPV